MFAILLLFLFLLSPFQTQALETSNSVSVSAIIGENEVSIFGYTSPNSKVELTGINIYSLDYSDNIGYFEFNNLVLPRNSSELCLQSKDDSSRSSSLICTPPPPSTNYHTDIGPIILPPTVSLEQDNIHPNTTVISSGQSIPKSTVIVYFYKINDSAQSFPKSALAYSLPKIETTTDEKGNYSINLPTAYSSDYRLYTSVTYNDNFSPKSNTLLYTMPSLFWLFLQQHAYLMVILPIFIFSLLLFFLLLFFNSPKIHHLRSKIKFLPALRTSYPAIRLQHFPVIYPDHLPRNSKIPV
ncbi:MAG: hypothetical protein PHS06_01610 [Candidatus Shapirobacteria bacterium]|nr:hypothetical protein [Candidatus Shapirobacteria bacterium]